MAPSAQVPQSKLMLNTSMAALLTTGLAAMPVRNMLEVMRFACAPTSARNLPARSGCSSGVLSRARERESMIGAKMPPPRAVLEGTAGPNNSSLAHSE